MGGKLNYTSIIGSFLTLIVIIAVAYITNATQELVNLDVNYLVLASIVFLLNILLWILAWAYLIRSHRRDLSYGILLKAGLGAVWGILTPLNIGTDVLRAVLLKKYGVKSRTSLSCSFVAKLIKFVIIAISAILALFLVHSNIPKDIFYALLIGLAVVIIPIIFLHMIISEKVYKRLEMIPIWGKKLMEISEKFSEVYKNMSIKDLAVVSILLTLSWIMEYLTMYFCFEAFSVSISLVQLFLFATLLYLLSKIPWLPQGVGLVEPIGILLISTQTIVTTPVSIAQIGSILVLWDITRIWVPIFVAGGVSGLFLERIN